VALVAPAAAPLPPGAITAFIASTVLLTAMAVPASAGLVTQALRRIPDRVRQAAAAAGARRLFTIAAVIVPAVRRRIAAALLAAFLRAIGEATALQILFAWLGPSGGGARTVASWIFQTATLRNDATGLPALALPALALLLVCVVGTFVIDREFRGMQWV